MPLKEQRDAIFVKLGYYPSPEQAAFHDDPSRFKLAAGGERGGKSKVVACDYLGKFWETPLLWLVGADYARTGPEFTYICEGFAKLGIDFEATKQLDPGVITARGFTIVTKSAKDPRTLASVAPSGIIVCEASQIDYESFLRLRGRLSEKRGWMDMSGTFESSLGWYPELYTRWQLPNADDGHSFSLPTWANKAIFPGGRNDPEILAMERLMPHDFFMERCGGVPCPPKGRVFSEFTVTMHTGLGDSYEFDPALPVQIWVDPGYATAYSVLAVQFRNDHVWVVDEVFERGLVTSEIIKVCKQRPWWKNVSGGAIDIAARQHQAMPAPAEIWSQEAHVFLQSKRVEIRDGIERIKTYLVVNPLTNQPLLHINAKVRGLISEMGGCENPITGQSGVYSWRKDREDRIIGEVPEDANNHACKALAYGLVSKFGYTGLHRRQGVQQF